MFRLVMKFSSRRTLRRQAVGASNMAIIAIRVKSWPMLHSVAHSPKNVAQFYNTDPARDVPIAP